MPTGREMIELADQHGRFEHAYDFDATLDTMVDDCYQHHINIGLRCDGSSDVRRYYEELFTAFPDMHMEDIQRATGDDVLVMWGRLVATMKGPWLGMDATHRAMVDLPFAVVIAFRGDKIFGETQHYDGTRWAESLGLDYDLMIARAPSWFDKTS